MKRSETRGNSSLRGQRNDRLDSVRARRHYYDLFTSKLIAFSGIGVIVTISLIFIYLLNEILPLFKSAEIHEISQYSVPNLERSRTLHWALDERGDSALRIGTSKQALFLNAQTGEVLDEIDLPIEETAQITAFALESAESGIFAMGLDTGGVWLAQYVWQPELDSRNSQRLVAPRIVPLFSLPASPEFSAPIENVAIRSEDGDLLLAITTADSTFALVEIASAANQQLGAESGELVVRSRVQSMVDSGSRAFIDGDGRYLLQVAQGGETTLYDINHSIENGALTAVAAVNIAGGDGQEISSVDWLLGELSLLVATQTGELSQWVAVRVGDRVDLVRVREFEFAGEPITQIATEQRRRNFAAADSRGSLALYNTTSNRTLLEIDLPSTVTRAVAISPRGTRLLVEYDKGEIGFWRIENPHPEFSFSALWNRIWYESYPEPAYVWQSSSASNDFEAKFSLTPLTFGTFKAAFYAMLFASPLAICAAIYTGYFMTPRLRRKVKPSIELMEALPTVVLGFLAGLWLAPFVESNLMGILSLLIFMPLGIGLCSFAWFSAPKSIRYRLSEGWEAILLVPLTALIVGAALVLGDPVEAAFFGGNLQEWLNEQYGLGYNERNAMIVGFAMGFAVIPTIYSIAEDAIFSVPRHLSDGSLALGATAWQSMFYVVLPMASPGIFSALMIGLGRAVGETMIVLMATGNTPIIDINMFEGMRTLAANIAIEIPESEVDSSHYRILFLAAMCLFLFTFVLNTVAEIVRERLRRKYTNL